MNVEEFVDEVMTVLINGDSPVDDIAVWEPSGFGLHHQERWMATLESGQRFIVTMEALVEDKPPEPEPQSTGASWISGGMSDLTDAQLYGEPAWINDPPMH